MPGGKTPRQPQRASRLHQHTARPLPVPELGRKERIILTKDVAARSPWTSVHCSPVQGPNAGDSPAPAEHG